MMYRLVVILRRVLSATWWAVQHVVHGFFHLIVFTPLIRLFFKIEIVGRKNIPHRAGFILASNHQSGFDPVVMAVAFWWRSLCFLAKISLWKSRPMGWILGLLLTATGQIPVDRKDPVQAEASLHAGAALVKHGGVFCIYPGGTRTVGRIPIGRLGVARVAFRSGCPVVPVGIIGMDAISHNFPRPWRRAQVMFVVGEAIYIGDNQNPTKAEQTAAVAVIMSQIAHLSELEYGGQP